MAFSDFKAIPDVQEKFRITYTTDNLLGTEEIVNPSEQFLNELEFSMQHINVLSPKAHGVKPLSTPFCGRFTKDMLTVTPSG